jgi:endonuclease/exonuclease/phosphatase family metal-dependent hydrolase
VAAVTKLNFAQFDLRDNVGLLAVLKLKAALAQKQQQHKAAGKGKGGKGQGKGSGRASAQAQRQQRERDREREASRHRRSQQQQRNGRKRHASADPTSAARRSYDSDDSDSDGGARRSRIAAAAVAAAAAVDGPRPAYVSIANTHILFNPKRGDIKLAQLRLLVQRLKLLTAAAVPPAEVGHVVALLMGDFNSTPHTPLYTFMRQGWVDCLAQHRKDMAGACVEEGHGPWRSMCSGAVFCSAGTCA